MSKAREILHDAVVECITNGEYAEAMSILDTLLSIDGRRAVSEHRARSRRSTKDTRRRPWKLVSPISLHTVPWYCILAFKGAGRGTQLFTSDISAVVKKERDCGRNTVSAALSMLKGAGFLTNGTSNGKMASYVLTPKGKTELLRILREKIAKDTNE